MTKTLIWTPNGRVTPEEALHKFIARTFNPEQLKRILDELCENAIDIARRACAYVIQDPFCWTICILKKAQDFMTALVTKKPKSVGEKIAEAGTFLHSIQGKKAKVRITFYERLRPKVLQQVISNPSIRFLDSQEIVNLIGYIEIGSWKFVPRTYTAIIEVSCEKSLWELTGLLSEAAESIQKIKTLK